MDFRLKKQVKRVQIFSLRRKKIFTEKKKSRFGRTLVLFGICAAKIRIFSWISKFLASSGEAFGQNLLKTGNFGLFFVR
jgi:hypothetical protein